jgi:hypothetical protein
MDGREKQMVELGKQITRPPRRPWDDKHCNSAGWDTAPRERMASQLTLYFTIRVKDFERSER